MSPCTAGSQYVTVPWQTLRQTSTLRYILCAAVSPVPFRNEDQISPTLLRIMAAAHAETLTRAHDHHDAFLERRLRLRRPCGLQATEAGRPARAQGRACRPRCTSCCSPSCCWLACYHCTSPQAIRRTREQADDLQVLCGLYPSYNWTKNNTHTPSPSPTHQRRS